MEVTRRNLEDALRFMGVPREGHEKMLSVAQVGFAQLAKYATPRKVYATFPLRVTSTSIVLGDGSVSCQSKNLARLFARCHSCVALAVTLGPAVDRQTRLLSKVDMAKAVAFDACASVWADSLCDDVEREIGETLKEGEHLTIRFSPGYGDVPMGFSRDIINILGATKAIGLTLSARGMMIPIKSVTALFGVSPFVESRKRSCAGCKPDICPFRKDGVTCYDD